MNMDGCEFRVSRQPLRAPDRLFLRPVSDNLNGFIELRSAQVTSQSKWFGSNDGACRPDRDAVDLGRC